MSVDVTDIKLNHDRDGFIAFECKSDRCEHAWEPHLWEAERAYCPRCGSYARLATHSAARDGGGE